MCDRCEEQKKCNCNLNKPCNCNLNKPCNCNLNKPCNCKLTNNKKWIYTLYTTIIFILVANPYTYKLTNYLIGKTSNIKGCPTTFGFVLHVIVFTLLLRAIM